MEKSQHSTHADISFRVNETSIHVSTKPLCIFPATKKLYWTSVSRESQLEVYLSGDFNSYCQLGDSPRQHADPLFWCHVWHHKQAKFQVLYWQREWKFTAKLSVWSDGHLFCCLVYCRNGLVCSFFWQLDDIVTIANQTIPRIFLPTSFWVPVRSYYTFGMSKISPFGSFPAHVIVRNKLKGASCFNLPLGSASTYSTIKWLNKQFKHLMIWRNWKIKQRN